MRKTIFINYDIHSTTLGMSAFMNNKVFFPKLTFKFIGGAGGVQPPLNFKNLTKNVLKLSKDRKKERKKREIVMILTY